MTSDETTTEAPAIDPDDTVWVTSTGGGRSIDIFHDSEDCRVLTDLTTRRIREYQYREMPDEATLCEHCQQGFGHGSHEDEEYQSYAHAIRAGKLGPEDFGLDPLETPEEGDRRIG